MVQKKLQSKQKTTGNFIFVDKSLILQFSLFSTFGSYVEVEVEDEDEDEDDSVDGSVDSSFRRNITISLQGMRSLGTSVNMRMGAVRIVRDFDG